MVHFTDRAIMPEEVSLRCDPTRPRIMPFEYSLGRISRPPRLCFTPRFGWKYDVLFEDALGCASSSWSLAGIKQEPQTGARAEASVDIVMKVDEDSRLDRRLPTRIPHNATGTDLPFQKRQKFDSVSDSATVITNNTATLSLGSPLASQTARRPPSPPPPPPPTYNQNPEDNRWAFSTPHSATGSIPQQPQPQTNPKTLIFSFYGKRKPGIQLQNKQYTTWDNGKKTPNLRFTASFVCPITQERFVCGQYGPTTMYDVLKDPTTQADVVWYTKKSTAEHGVAARAYDCLRFRESRQYSKLCVEEPYHPNQGPPQLMDGQPSSADQTSPAYTTSSRPDEANPSQIHNAFPIPVSGMYRGRANSPVRDLHIRSIARNPNRTATRDSRLPTGHPPDGLSFQERLGNIFDNRPPNIPFGPPEGRYRGNPTYDFRQDRQPRDNQNRDSHYRPQFGQQDDWRSPRPPPHFQQQQHRQPPLPPPPPRSQPRSDNRGYSVNNSSPSFPPNRQWK